MLGKKRIPPLLRIALSLQQKTFMKVQSPSVDSCGRVLGRDPCLISKSGIGKQNEANVQSNHASPNMGVIMHPAELCVHSVLVCLSCYADLERSHASLNKSLRGSSRYKDDILFER
jgi:hypothetical protein